MGVASKAFVGLNNGVNTLDVLKAVKEALDVYSRAKFDKFIKDSIGEYSNRFQSKLIKEETGLYFTNGVNVLTNDFESFSFEFGCGEYISRKLFCCTNYHKDYEDIYVGDKITFLLGSSGSCEEIIGVVCEALKPFGKVFYDLNDCDDVDFQEYCGNIKSLKS